MAGFLSGAALKLLQTFLYAVEFCCAALIVGIYSYFLAVLADRDLPISAWKKAVEGISGAAVIYLIFAVLLTCCLGGFSLFALLAIILDVLFCAGFIALAVMTRDGAHSCSGHVNTPLGNGPASSKNGFGSNGFGTGNGENTTYSVSLGTACRLNKAAFAVSVAGALLFLLSTLLQVALARHHRKERRYGPSPANNYTSGSGTNRNLRFWSRKPKTDAELGAVPAAGVRPSDETGYTGSTVAPTGPTTSTYDAYGKPILTGTAGGYHTAPQGTGYNPYGYDRRSAGNF